MENKTTQKSMFPTLLAVGIIIVIAIGGFLLLKKPASKNNITETIVKEEETQTPSEAMPIDEAKGQEAMTDDKVLSVEIEAGSFYYKPNVIKAKKGQTVKVTLKSKDMMHNFYLDEFNVKSETVKAGNSATFEFTPTKTGTFEFFCGVGRHRSLGQVGKLIVE